MRKIGWISCGAVACVVAIGLLAPTFVRSQVAAALTAQAGRTVDIGSVSVGWTSASIGLHGINGGTDLTAGRIEADVALLPLLRRTVLFERVTIADGRLTLEFDADGNPLSAGGVSLVGDPESAADPPPDPWSFDFRRVELRSVAVAVQPWRHDIEVNTMTLVTPGVWDSPVDVNGGLAVDGNRIGLDVQVRVPERSVNGGVTVTRLDLARYAAYTGLSMEGLLSLDQRVSVDAQTSLQASAEGTVLVEELAVSEGLDVNAGSLNWEGQVDVDLTDQGIPRVSAGGDLNVENLRLGRLFESERIAARGIRVSAHDRSVEMDALHLAQPRVTLQRNPDGALDGLPARPEEPQTTSEVEPLPVVSIGEFRAESGSAVYNDLSVSPPVNLSLRELHVSADSVTTQDAFDVELSAHHRETDAEANPGLRIAGTIDPAKTALALRVDLEDFELFRVGPYLGADVQRGRLSITTEGMVGDNISLSNSVLIEGLKAKHGDGGDDGLPLALALALLEDNKGRIELEVPLEVARGQLDVGVRDVVSRAVRNATAKAATTYAKFALQPLGGLLLARDVAGRLMRPRFEPLGFERSRGEEKNDVRVHG